VNSFLDVISYPGTLPTDTHGTMVIGVVRCVCVEVAIAVSSVLTAVTFLTAAAPQRETRETIMFPNTLPCMYHQT